MVLARSMRKVVRFPKGVSARYDDRVLTVKGPKGEVNRTFSDPRLEMELGKDDQGNPAVTIHVDKPGRREKAMLGTWRSHVRNMVAGVGEGYEYQLKICYSHFPIKTAVKGQDVVIENFLGERHPRMAHIRGSATKVVIKGELVTVTGPELEAVSQTAANIEMATRIRRFDPRVFQDGIYIIAKGR